MQRFTVGVDLDNVIVQSDPMIRGIISQISNVALAQDEIVEFAYAAALVARGLNRSEAEAIERHALNIFHEAECGRLELVPGALDGLLALKEAGASTVIVTSRPTSAEGLTQAGLIVAKISCSDLLFAADKSVHASDWLCLVDDAPHHARSVAAAGIPVCVLDYPWNRLLPPHPLIRRCSDWPQIVDGILQIARSRGS